MQWFMVILEHHSHDKKKKKTEKQKKNIERGTKKKGQFLEEGPLHTQPDSYNKLQKAPYGMICCKTQEQPA